MRKTDLGLPSAPVVEVMLTASTQPGALCGREAADGCWRKSTQAFSAVLCSAEPLSLRGKPSLKASCASAEDAAPIREKSATMRTSIWLRRLYQCGRNCKLCVASNTAERML